MATLFALAAVVGGLFVGCVGLLLACAWWWSRGYDEREYY